MLPDLLPAALTLTYERSTSRLRAAWVGPVGEAELCAQYLELLAAAVAHANCRFWLLDLRARAWHSPEFGRWFGEEFARQARAALRGPVFLAYVLDPSSREAVSSPNVQAAQRGCAAHDVYPFFFDDEPAAEAWLQHQQDLDAGQAWGS